MNHCDTIMDPVYRISTITATGSVNTEINLDVLFYDAITICEEDKEGVVYVEYGKKKAETMYKGFSKKFLVNKRKVSTTSKRFENQVTIVYRKIRNGQHSLLNTKVFRNGNLQITGIKYVEQGYEMVDTIIDILQKGYKETQEEPIVKDITKLRNTDYKVRLINSDFNIGFPIKRDLLYKVIYNQYTKDCSYEPCIYPGVKVQYFYNTVNECKDGICHCESQCIVGKGSGKGPEQCKKITVAIFQSGCVIITGAQSYHQINEAYAYVTTLLRKHRDEIERKTIVPVVIQETPKKIILINKKNIIYPKTINHHQEV